MLRNRLVVALLLRDAGLVNTKNFKVDKYLGDPINAVKIFNDKLCDELLICDYRASCQQAEPDYELIQGMAEEAKMPICYAGGVRSPNQAARLINIGAEKIGICSGALEQPNLLRNCALEIGSQSVVGVIDYKKRSGFLRQRNIVCAQSNQVHYERDPLDLARSFQQDGVGEILFNSIDRDGMRIGYDIELATQARKLLNVPITMMGGASTLDDVKKLTDNVGLIGAAASSIFVYKGKHDAILLQYPESEVKSNVTILPN